MSTRNLLLLPLALLSFSVAAAEVKIGYVNTERVYREAQPALNAQKKLEREFATREAELKKLAARGKELEGLLAKNKTPSPERRQMERELESVDREYQAKARDFRDDLNQRRNEEFAAVQERANRVIRQMAEREQYDLILQDVVYVSRTLDITDKVLKELGK
ncbi:OmpH family outer membrane protein [Vogesella urethralis]|jgi:outer membrane protein|uniref:OmpH family outer membrane protein n=1 Tax=Vogesella urethralis TaxID=2592656 RepID=UPI001184BB71|nr:OmpH family outer membrane protein [Vogesella urethralis]MEC5207703.1 outer membrane protein [Vogesella perlucida]